MAQVSVCMKVSVCLLGAVRVQELLQGLEQVHWQDQSCHGQAAEQGITQGSCMGYPPS